jgi:hypothetical protein
MNLSDKDYELTTLEKAIEFDKNRNYQYTINMYTITFTGEFGQEVQETWNREQILKAHWTNWNRKMFQSGNSDDVNEDNCIKDWVINNNANEL